VTQTQRINDYIPFTSIAASSSTSRDKPYRSLRDIQRLARTTLRMLRVLPI
jgi:hypothetical protein